MDTQEVSGIMRRAFYEWGAIFTLALSLSCFAYWAISITTRIADFETWLYPSVAIVAFTSMLPLFAALLVRDWFVSIREN